MPLSLRLLSIGILLTTAGLTLLVQHVVRPAVEVNVPVITVVLGFLPNLFVGIGAPFISTVIARRVPGTRQFGKYCIIILVVLLLHEYDQLNAQRLRFDWYDVAASIVGVLMAWWSYAKLHDRMGLATYHPQQREFAPAVDDAPGARRGGR